MYTSIASVALFPPVGGCWYLYAMFIWMCWDEYEANVNCRTKFSSCIWKLSFHLWFNFFPQCMLVVQSCCFPIVGWRGNSSGFYMEIAFSLPLLTSKYFTTFFSYLLLLLDIIPEWKFESSLYALGKQLCMMHQWSFPQIAKNPRNILFPFTSSIFQKRKVVRDNRSKT